MKKLYTTKFHNFLRHTTFMFAVSPFEVVYKFFLKKNNRRGPRRLHDRWVPPSVGSNLINFETVV
jgi:hypothetical protein